MSRRAWFTPLVCLVFLVGTGAARAQSAGPEDVIDADGALQAVPSLTAAQKGTIYNAVLAQRLRTSTTEIPKSIGAPVPPSAALADLPGAIDMDDPALLKYAMVEGDVVVVDSVRMRVVDIIHRGARP
jgi:hypothetical protein